MTYEKIFAELKKMILKADTKKLEGQFAFQFCIEGEGAGSFYMALKDGDFSVEPYNYEDNTATFKASADTFKKLLDGSLDTGKAIADGALIVEGNDSACANIFGFIAAKKATKAAKEEKKPAKEEKKAPKAEVKTAPKAEVKAPAKPAAKPAAKAPAKPAAKASAKPASKKSK